MYFSTFLYERQTWTKVKWKKSLERLRTFVVKFLIRWHVATARMFGRNFLHFLQ